MNHILRRKKIDKKEEKKKEEKDERNNKPNMQLKELTRDNEDTELQVLNLLRVNNVTTHPSYPPLMAEEALIEIEIKEKILLSLSPIPDLQMIFQQVLHSLHL